MACVMFWVTWGLLVLILKQSDAECLQYSDLDNDIFHMESYIKRIILLKEQNEHFYEECKVSIFIYIYILSLERHKITRVTGPKSGKDLVGC